MRNGWAICGLAVVLFMFGITKSPATRYTQEEPAGGKLRIVGQGPREEMLQLERNIHETLPIGPEEAQKFYIQKQVQRASIRPPMEENEYEISTRPPVGCVFVGGL